MTGARHDRDPPDPRHPPESGLRDADPGVAIRRALESIGADADDALDESLSRARLAALPRAPAGLVRFVEDFLVPRVCERAGSQVAAQLLARLDPMLASLAAIAAARDAARARR